MVFDYLQSHPEERHHWTAKVRALATSAINEHVAAVSLEAELWRYFEERSEVVSPFRELAHRGQVGRTSMKNLAEYLLRLWLAPRPRKTQPPAEPA